MADLTAKASSATSVPGIPVPGNACASKTATSDLSVFKARVEKNQVPRYLANRHYRAAKTSLFTIYK